MLPNIRGLAVMAAVLVPASLSAQASAHATLAVTHAAPNSNYRAVIRIPHGCNGAATTAVRVTIPEGVINAKPMPKPGWTLTVKRGPYAKSYEEFGERISEGAKEINWSNGNLPDAYYDEFVFMAHLAADLPVGKMLYFPVVQDCGNASERWVGIPAAAQSPHSMPNPAPGLMIVAADQSAGASAEMPMSMPMPGAATYKVGRLVVSAPWIRATPKGAPVAGGYLKITNNGTAPDRLIGGSLAAAASFQVHQMTMDHGVMRMRPVAGGLEIKPGQTVELSPDGYHIMFMGLKRQLKPGETIKGTLKFAKAGTVEISYPVVAMGAPAPGAGMGMHMPMQNH